MAFRLCLSLTLLVLTLACGSSALAQTPGESAMQIMSYEQLIRLPHEEQIQYLKGLRDMLADLEKMQRDSQSASTASADVGARIEFLKLFIQEAEARGPEHAVACPASLLNNPRILAHTRAGGVFHCYPHERRSCPAGIIHVGFIGSSGVCLDVRHEDYKKWRANQVALHVKPYTKAQLNALAHPKSKSDLRTVAFNSKPASDRKVAARAKPKLNQVDNNSGAHKPSNKNSGAENADAADSGKSAKPAADVADTGSQASEPPVAGTDGAKASVDPATLATQQANEKKAYDKHDSAKEKADAAAFDQVSGTDDLPSGVAGVSSSADQLTVGAKADEVVQIELDPDGVAVETRRKVADFQLSTGRVAFTADSKSYQCDPKWSGYINPDSPNAPKNPNTGKVDLTYCADHLIPGGDPVCQSAIPTSEEADPQTCNQQTLTQARKDLQAEVSRPGSQGNYCFVGGMVSNYKDNQVGAKGCQATREFCMNRITCREKKDGSMAPNAQVLYSCKPGEVICNPYIFNLGRDNKPICVKNGSNVTRQCVSRANDDHPFFQYAGDNQANGLIEGWNEFANQFNKMCFHSPEKDYYCRECAMIRFRLVKLHELVLHADDNHVCGQMITFKSKRGGAGGTNGSGRGGPVSGGQSAEKKQ